MTGVIESGEFITMKTIVAASYEMDNDSGEREEEEKSRVAGPERMARG
jgi:hypothetical protein